MIDLIVGSPSGTVRVQPDTTPPPLEVRTSTPTATGFVVTFHGQMDVRTLAVAGPASDGDIWLRGEKSGVVRGSAVIDDSGNEITFIRSGGLLAPDSYTVTVRGGTDGFQTPDGYLLDGNRDGVAGDDYTTTFVIEPSDDESITVGISDFVEGPGERFQLPIALNQEAGVRGVDLWIRYDPKLLEITSATVAADMPPGAALALNAETPGLAILAANWRESGLYGFQVPPRLGRPGSRIPRLLLPDRRIDVRSP